jgi:hypothetical protein
MNEFKQTGAEILQTIYDWELRLKVLTDEKLNSKPINGWSIKEILGHLIDSATNNIHRVIHLQYQPIPLVFPNYGSEGNNSNWIKIQNYEGENWQDMLQLWKYTNLHLAHVIENINPDKLDNIWIAGPGREIKLGFMIEDYVRHMKQHLAKIGELAGN